MKATKIIFVLILVAFVAAVGALVATDSGDGLAIEGVTIVTSLSGDRVATGEVVNLTGEPVSGAQVVAEFLDYDGVVVGAATSTVGAMQPGGRAKFEVPVEQERATSVRARATVSF